MTRRLVKFAVEALTDSDRHELSQFGVDIVLVQPSAYPTRMYAAIRRRRHQRRHCPVQHGVLDRARNSAYTDIFSL